ASLIDPTIWGAEELGIFGELYIIRNLAMAAGVALAALWLRSQAAILATIAARYLTDFVDITAAFARGPDAETTALLAAFTVILLIIPAPGLVWLVRQTRPEDPYERLR
ncbi:MAG: hypothetical protein AAF618_09060, partial [Pseudomonadota bacterium]